MPTQTFFLEEWLRNSSSSSNNNNNKKKPSPSSARAIIQAWSDLRDSLQHQTFQPQHFQSLQTLLNSQITLHVADPQAKILLSVLSSLSPPHEALPLFLKLLYIWLRKSSKPSPSLLESALSVLSPLLSNEKTFTSIRAQGILILGAISSVPSLSPTSKDACLELLCKLLEQEGEVVPEVLAGVGYALSSSKVDYFSRILSSLFRFWSKVNGTYISVTYGLMVLHLVEWVVLSFINFRSFEKIDCICRNISEFYNLDCRQFAVVMAAAGALRALNRSVSGSGGGIEVGPQIRNVLEECIESVARDLLSKTGDICSSSNDPNDRLVLQCISVGLSRCGLISYCGPFLSCLVSALLGESFPLRSFYKRVIEYPYGNVTGLDVKEFEEHLSSIVFREAGAITRAFCEQYVAADEQNKIVVENLIWSYCTDLYSGHRLAFLVLHDEGKELLGYLEKIAEACFLMVVVFASVVTKHKLNLKYAREIQLEVSVKILISFSCIEYFRRVRLPEYTDTIRGVVASVQENDISCVSFVESMPSYAELTNYPCSLGSEKEYIWSKDDVQTARMLFYLRVIPTCIERVPCTVFREVVASTMFLYLGHPNGKVARASHSAFVAFISSGKDSNQDDRDSLKEQLVFYYIQRALEGYPGITPFEGMASGVASLVRHLPAGSPAIFYCIHSLVEKADSLCSKAVIHDADVWKNWQGDSESSKKVVELLLRLISLVDIQVLPNLMKLLAQLIVRFPKDGQDMILDELHSLVSESEDVTRKPALVSWLQSLSFLSSQSSISNMSSEVRQSVGNGASVLSTDTPSLNRTRARL